MIPHIYGYDGNGSVVPEEVEIGDTVVCNDGHEWEVTNIAEGRVWCVGPVFWNFAIADTTNEVKQLIKR